MRRATAIGLALGIGASARVARANPPASEGVSRAELAWIAAGAAVASAGVGVGFGVAALDAKTEFDANPTHDVGVTGNNDAVYCDVALGAAVAFGATSLILFLTQPSADRRSPPAVSFAASPVVLAHGAGAGAIVRF